MSASDDRREAVKKLAEDRKVHEQKTGKALPDSRQLEKWAADIGRRNDRQDADKKPRR